MEYGYLQYPNPQNTYLNKLQNQNPQNTKKKKQSFDGLLDIP